MFTCSSSRIEHQEPGVLCGIMFLVAYLHEVAAADTAGGGSFFGGLNITP